MSTDSSKSGRPESDDAAVIQSWLVAQIAEMLDLTPSDIDPNLTFEDLGLGSSNAISLSGDLEDWLGRRLSPTLIYEYPTVATLAQYLAAGEPTPGLELDGAGADRRASPGALVAVVGIGCRFPGASSPQAFWRLLCDGVDAIGEVPPERWDVGGLYEPTPATPGKMNTRWGGFLEQVDQFDTHFFGIAPREAARMDPQQRVLLEVAWEALEHAGIVPEQLAGSQTGVFVGIGSYDYALRQHSDLSALEVYVETGSSLSIASNRLSYLLDLRGPSISVDTACSSSLVAVHLALRSLRSGETDLALAAGVNLILSPEVTISFSQAGMMAADGRCKTFDARADGYVRSEGCGVLVLKRLDDALREGDRVLALIRGSAVNQDGRSNGLTAPNGHAQQEVVRAALADAGVVPDQVGYIEAHGTGTILGDPIEVRALAAVMQDRARTQPCFIGSVKTNIGHLEAAAGVAGLIKVILSLHHGAIPPHLHVESLNPHIGLDDTALEIPTDLRAWPAEGSQRVAGVSSFGFGGTNAHVIVSVAPPAPAVVPAPTPDAADPWLLPLTARSPQALRALAQQVAAQLATTAPTALPDLVYTAAQRRTHHAERVAVVGHTPAQLAAALTAFAHDQPAPDYVAATRASQRPRVVFVCPGQGGQWAGMARDLLAHAPAFAAELHACDQALQPLLGWSLVAALTADPPPPTLTQIDGIQPALFALSLALAALWRYYGVLPDALVGHSMGEVAAAVLAGALSREDAAQVIIQRSRLLRRISGQGAMALVALPLAEAAAALAPYAGQLAVAVSNSPRASVVAGDPAALETLLADLAAQQVFCRRVQVDVAAHSPQVDPLVAPLVAGLAGLVPQAATVPFVSTVTGTWLSGPELDAAYWGRNLRAPVRFGAAVAALGQAGHTVFVELGPHPLLLGAVGEGVAGAVLVPALRRGADGPTVLRAGLGQLWAQGCAVDWQALAPAGRCVDLPTYPWQRERFWAVAAQDERQAARQAGAGGHPLLGLYVASAAPAGLHLWEADLTRDSVPYLADHQVQGRVVLPAAAYAELALAAGQQVGGAGRVVLEQLRLTELLTLDTVPVRVQVTLREDGAGTAAFQVASRAADAAPGTPWLAHATGTVRMGGAIGAGEAVALAGLRAQAGAAIDGAAFYTQLAARGYGYGPRFQGLGRVWAVAGGALAELTLAEDVSRTLDRYQVHPALLDSCFQTLGVALLGQADAQHEGPLYLPTAIRQLQVMLPSGSGRWAYAQLQQPDGPPADTLLGDVTLLDEDGQVVLEVRGLEMRRLEQGRASELSTSLNHSLYMLQWQAQERPTASMALSGGWLVFADRHGVADALSGLLQAQGGRVVTVTPGTTFGRGGDAYTLDPSDPTMPARLLQEAFPDSASPCCGIIHLWGLEIAPPSAELGADLPPSQTLGEISVLHLVHALARARWRDMPRLWLVTSGVHAAAPGDDPAAVAQAPLWGLRRVLGHEHPELRCTGIDLPAGTADARAAELLAEVGADSDEDEIALRVQGRYVARLVRYAQPEMAAPTAAIPALAGRDPLRLEVTAPGRLDSLMLRSTTRTQPGPGEVEINVHAAGIAFRDVLRAMGRYPDPGVQLPVLGDECAGVISAVGPGVVSFAVGDAVVGVARGVFGSFVITRATCVAHKPARLSFADAATIPTAFCTAYYALHHLARLQPGERVLIHAATGGVGLAAIQLARRVGAEIFATAGSPAKRAHLRSLGIEHVFDSRALDFAEAVRERTQGQGVDVVLNSLAGAAIPRGLECLADYGRFIEIGKKDIYQNNQIDLWPFHKCLTFAAVDLDHFFRQRPRQAQALLQDVVALFDEGALDPLPQIVMPVGAAQDALRTMAQAQHIGKLVLDVYDQPVTVAPPAAAAVAFRADGTYLITGGLGGLGLLTAEWMVQRGARHLALLGRREPTAAQRQQIAGLEQAGAEVHVLQADITRPDDVRRALADMGRALPPLRGVFHTAAVLEDATLLRQDAASFARAMAPKVQGAWLLHVLTLGAPLDYFVLFSSAAALLGSPGQGNYVAGNTFLDALAHHRRAHGWPALSINWGPWAEVGLAASQDNRGERLAFRGMASLTPEQGLAALDYALSQQAAQISVMLLDVRQWCQFYPKVAEAALLRSLVQDQAASPAAQVERGAVRAMLGDAPPEQRRALLETHLREQIALVLRLSPAQISAQTPLGSLGFDSLMALELRNRLEANLGVTLPATLIWSYPSIASMTVYLADLMGLPLSDEAGAVTPPEHTQTLVPADDQELADILADIDQLSEEEVLQLLRADEPHVD